MLASAAAIDPRRGIVVLAFTIFTAAASIPPGIERRRIAMRSVCRLITVDVAIPARTTFAATARVDYEAAAGDIPVSWGRDNTLVRRLGAPNPSVSTHNSV